jgi:hypothetical protein
MSNSNQDHDRDRDHTNDPANDNGGQGSGSKPSVPAVGAFKALTALQTQFAKVNIAAIAGRTGLPMLLYKAREGIGTWGFGQKRTIPEEGSRWAMNPLTFMWGYLSFNGKKVAGEQMVPVSQEKPDITKLPDTGFPWQGQWSVEMKCLDGADAGVEVIFKANTDGTLSAIVEKFDLVRKKIDDELRKQQENPDYKIDDKIAPIMTLGTSWYPHKEHGRTNIPVLADIGWMSLDGPAPTPAPAPEPMPPTDQPRRRRVA